MITNKAKAGKETWQKSNTKWSSALQCCLSGPAAGSVSWNDGEPKYDIRDWSPDGTRMGKGISLSGEELAILKGILEDLEL
mgnify:CR=1 FL=1